MGNHNHFNIDQVSLENVTLMQAGVDPVLSHVDFEMPLDQTVVVESSNPNSALQFLQFLAGVKPCASGRILWNGKDVFSDESDIDPRQAMSFYLEGVQHYPNTQVGTYLASFATADEVKDICEQMNVTPYLNNDMSKLSYGVRKLLNMVQAVAKNPELLILEDPAQGLTEEQWLNFLDYVQFKQRRGHLRHIFITNHHPTALNHLAHNKIFLEEGVIYFDEAAPSKKVAHF